MSNAIGIRIGDEFLELGDASITLELVSPLFSNELGSNSHSFSFTIPATPHNRRLLGRPHTLMAPLLSEVSGWLYLFGNPYEEALIEIGDSSYEEVQISLKLGISPLISSLSKRNLRDYNYGGVRQISSTPHDQDINNPSDILTHAGTVAAGDVDSYDYAFFPVYDPEFYGPEPDVVPRDFFQDSDERNVIINRWVNGGFQDEVRLTVQGEHAGYTPLIPFPYLLYVLRQIIDQEGYSLSEIGTFLSNAQVRTLTVWNNQTLDKPFSTTFLGNPVTRTANLHKEAINVLDHIPSVNARTLLAEINKTFCLFLDMAGGSIKMVWKGDVLTAETVDWTKKVIAYQVQPEAVSYYAIDSKADEDQQTWLDPTDLPPDYEAPTEPAMDEGETWLDSTTRRVYRRELVEGSNPAEFHLVLLGYMPTSFGSISDSNEDVSTTIGWMPTIDADSGYPATPATQERINTPMYGLEPIDKVKSIRLMFYRGLVSFGGSPLPFGSTSEHEYGSGLSNLLGLHWAGDRGLYETWWKDWIAFLTTSRKVNYNLSLRPADLYRIDWTKRYRLPVREGYAWGLPRKIRLQINRSGIQSAEAEMMMKT